MSYIHWKSSTCIFNAKIPSPFFFSVVFRKFHRPITYSSSVLGISFSAVFCSQLHSPANGMTAKLLFAVEEQTS